MKSQIKKLINVLFVLIFIQSFTFAQRVDFSGLKFCIDPGHGGHNPANDRQVIPDPGIVFWESESNFQKALLLDTLLKAKNAWVILTRYTNDYPDDNLEPTLSERAAIANANNVHFFHSIHSNATGGTNTGTNYTLILFRGYDNQPVFPQAKTMSSYIAPKINQHLRTSTYYVRGDWSYYPQWGTLGLGVLRPLQMPGQLSEGSFHDYFPETRRLMNQSYRKMEAYALLKAFMQYYGVYPDTFSIIAGIQTDGEVNKPKNGTIVRLLPENWFYYGDNYNNGFYMFEKVSPSTHIVKFETPNYGIDSSLVNVSVNGVHFIDKTLNLAVPPVIIATQPVQNDTAFKVNNFIGIRFSRKMDTASVRNAFSINPHATGNIMWASGNTVFFFMPNPNFQYNTHYTVVIDSTAKSSAGIPIDGNGDGIAGDPFILIFKTESQQTSVEDVHLPKSFKLYQNFPNPFNPSTSIRFDVPTFSKVKISVFDIHGQEIVELLNEYKSPGQYEILLDGLNIPSGVYFYRMSAGNFIQTKKMILLK